MRISPRTLISTPQEEISFHCTWSRDYESLELWGLPQAEGLPEGEANPIKGQGFRKDNFLMTSFEYLDPAIAKANNPWTFHL